LTLPGVVMLTTTLSNAYPDNASQPVTFTGGVVCQGSGTGAVTTDSGGLATCTLTNPAAGIYDFGASFAEDDVNQGATASGITGYPVNLGVQAALAITGAPVTVSYGDASFTPGTSGGSGNGAVSWLAPAGNGVLTIDPATGQVTILEVGGPVTITAVKSGGGVYEDAEATASITVGKAFVTVTLDSATVTYDGNAHALTATAIPSVALTYSYLGTGGASYGPSAIAPTAAGAYSVTASVSDTGHYTGLATATLTIDKAAQTIAFDPPVTQTYATGGTFGISATTDSGLQVTFNTTTPAVCGIGASAFTTPTTTATVTILSAGTCTITADQPGDANHAPATQVSRDIVIDDTQATCTSADTIFCDGFDARQPGFQFHPAGNI
jgi:hypothetical protein